MNCRACGSDRLRKLSLVYESGLSFTQSTTRGIGVGVGAMVGGGQTSGSQMTALSARAAPPARKQYSAQLALGAAAGALAFAYPIAWIAAVLFFAVAAQAIHWNSTTWPQLYSSWGELFMCERCGATSLPSTEPIAVRAASTTSISSKGPGNVLPG